jgi:hypothetical protein
MEEVINKLEEHLKDLEPTDQLSKIVDMASALRDLHLCVFMKRLKARGLSIQECSNGKIRVTVT